MRARKKFFFFFLFLEVPLDIYSVSYMNLSVNKTKKLLLKPLCVALLPGRFVDVFSESLKFVADALFSEHATQTHMRRQDIALHAHPVRKSIHIERT